MHQISGIFDKISTVIFFLFCFVLICVLCVFVSFPLHSLRNLTYFTLLEIDVKIYCNYVLMADVYSLPFNICTSNQA